MARLNDYLSKTHKAINEQRIRKSRDYDSPEQQREEEEEMMGEIPWYVDENGDGWNKEVDSIDHILSVSDEFQRLQYELNNARRGSYAVSGDTAGALLEHCRGLLLQLEEAVSHLEADVEQMGGE